VGEELRLHEPLETYKLRLREGIKPGEGGTMCVVKRGS